MIGKVIPPTGGNVLSVALSADGRWLAYAAGTSVYLLDRTTLTVRHHWPGQPALVRSLAFSGDSQTLAAGCTNGSCLRWEVASAQPRGKPIAYPGLLRGIGVNHTGTLVAFAGEKGLYLWSEAIQRGEPIPQAAHIYQDECVAFSPDGKWLHTGTGRIELATGRKANLATPSPHAWTCYGPSALNAKGDRLLVYAEHRLRVFDPLSRQETRSFGLSHYEVLLSVDSIHADRDGYSRPTTVGTLEALRQARGHVYLQIRRNGVVQVEHELPVPAGSLNISATREGGRVRAQVNAFPPLVFDDPFPVPTLQSWPGLVHWGSVAVEKLTLRQQILPSSPGALEQADVRFASGEPAEALALYETVAARTQATEAVAEARYKAALCLSGLNRLDEAADRLVRLSSEPAGRWSNLALAQLWLLRLRQDRLEDADAVYTVLATRGKVADLAGSLFPELRQTLLTRAGRRSSIAILTGSTSEGERLQLTMQLGRALRLDEHSPVWWMGLLLGLARNHFAADRREEGLRVLREGWEWASGREHAERRANLLSGLTNERVWTLLHYGRTPEALSVLEQTEPFAKGESHYFCHLRLWLTLDRVRVYAAQGDWRTADEWVRRAKADYEAFQQVSLGGEPIRPHLYIQHATYHILRGLISEAAGDPDAAQEAFRQGHWAAWRKTVPPEIAAIQSANSRAQIFGGAMAAWTGDTDLTEAQAFLDTFLKSLAAAGGGGPQTVVQLLNLRSELISQMWASPRGREFVRRYALQQASYIDYVRQPMKLLLHTYALTGAFREPSTEQERVVWELVEEGYREYLEQRLTTAHLVSLGLAWKGTTGLLGWASVGPQLRPSFRANLAYLLAHRALFANRRQEAAMYFGIVLKDAAQDTAVRGLVRRELKELGLAASP